MLMKENVPFVRARPSLVVLREICFGARMVFLVRFKNKISLSERDAEVHI